MDTQPTPSYGIRPVDTHPTTNSGDDYEYLTDNNDNDVDMTSQPAILTMMHDGRVMTDT